MKARPWTTAEIGRLRKEYGSKPNAELAAEFGRSIKSVQWIAYRYGFTTVKRCRDWRAICASHKPMIDLRRQGEAQ